MVCNYKQAMSITFHIFGLLIEMINGELQGGTPEAERKAAYNI